MTGRILKINFMTEEIWKDIEGFNNYQISSIGRVRSKERIVQYKNSIGTIRKLIPEKIKSLTISTSGYHRTNISDNSRNQVSKTIHQFVANAFLEKIPGKPFINHIDGNKLNNRIENLEWCTQSENISHAYRTGLKRPSEISKKWISQYAENSRKRPVLQYDLAGNFIRRFDSSKEASGVTGFPQGSISNNCLGKAKTVKGFIFKHEKSHLV
jgi:hypothetical protein